MKDKFMRKTLIFDEKLEIFCLPLLNIYCLFEKKLTNTLNEGKS